MKLWFGFIVLVVVAGICKSIPLKDNISNDNKVDEEMTRGKFSLLKHFANI